MAENTNYYDLYKALKADGAVKGDWNSFRSFVGASGKQGYLNRKKLYDALKADGAVKAGTYEEFHRGLYKAGKQWKAQRQNTASATKPSTVRNMAAQVANEYQGNGTTEVPKNASPFVQSLYETDNAMKGAEYPVNYTSPNAVKQVYEKNQQVKRDASRTAAKQNEWNRQNQPIYDNGTKGVMKTQGQLEKEIDDAAGKFIDSNMGDYISKAILDEQNAAMERGLEASGRVPATAGGAGGLGLMLKGMAFNKEVDPDIMGRNLSKSVQDNIQKIFSDPRYVKQIENEAAALGISTDGYIQSLASRLQGKLLSELDKSELKNALPKNGFENFANRFIGSNVLGNMIKTATQTKSQRAIDEQAMAATEAGENPYYKPGIWENVAADVAGMATDPVFHGSAGIGGKVAGKLIGSSDKIGAILANGNVMQRLGLNVGQAVTSGGVTGFVFGSSKGAIQNVSTGEDTSLGGTLKAALHGGLSEAGSFATMGVAGVPLGMVGRSVGLKSITTTPLTKEWFKQGSAKVGLEAAKTWMEGTGMYLGGYVAGKIEGREQPEFDIIDGTIESLPTAIGFRVQHLLKGLGSGRLRDEDGKELSWGKSTMLKFNEFLTSDKAKASKYLMSEDERNQILNSEATKEIMRSGDNMVSLARRAKSNKISYDDHNLETDMSMIRNSYDKIMADPNVSWDAKAKFSAMVMGVMPSSRPMADYHTFTLEKLGDDKVGYKKYINEYSAKGELLSKISYDTAEQRGDILYRRSVKTESDRFWNAYAALVNIEKNDYDLQNQFFAHEMKNWVRGDGNEERFMAGMKGYRGSTFSDKYTAYVADRSKMVSAALKETAEKLGMSDAELVKAVNKDPLKRTDAEQNACVELRKTFEKAAYPEGKAHEEQSKLDGKDVARENGLGTDAPNGEAVKQELVSLQEAEDGLQKLMDSNDVFKESYEMYKGQGLTNAEIYQRMIEEGGMTEEQLAPFAMYINANARVQGMQDATEQAVEQHVESVAADWGFHGTMDGQKADGSQIIYVKDSNGRTLIVGSGDVAYDPATGRPKEGVGDMLVCLDVETREPVYVKVEDTTLDQTQSVEDFKNEERARLQQINSEPYNEAAQEQAMSNAAKKEEASADGKKTGTSSTSLGGDTALSQTETGGKGTENNQNHQENSELYRVSDSLQDKIGGSLSEEETKALTNEMEHRAVVPRQIELTPDNWYTEFGEDGKVSTPIGEVKMGENQIAKLFERKRSKEFGMIKPTLEDPDAIIEVESSATDGKEERSSSYLFIKTFLGKNGEKVYYFKSVTVKKDGMEISISSHYDRAKRVMEELEKGKLLYLKRGGAQTEQNQPSVSGATSEEVNAGSSKGKDTNNSSNGNGNGATLTFETEQAQQGNIEIPVQHYTLGEKKTSKGDTFYQDESGNINMAEIPAEVFDSIGYTKAPFRLTESMVKHILDRHRNELGISTPDEAIHFVRDVMANFDHVRLGNDGALVFSIENGRKRTGKRAITIFISEDGGDFYGLKTSGFENMKGLERRPLLWERGVKNESSSTDTATANVATNESRLSGEHSGNASNQSIGLVGKDTNNSSNGNGNGATLTFADGSAVPMVKDSKGRETPDYGRMKPEQAAEILTRQFGESAEKVADGQISKAEKAVKKAEKMKVNYEGEPNDILEQEAVRREAIAQAKAQLEHAQATKKAMTAKKVAETMGKTEGKPAEGANQAGSVAAERFQKATRLVGNKRSRTLPNNEKITGHYEIMPAESLTPSHDATNGYRKSEGFPVDAEGRTTNDRDYENDKAAQQSTDQMALGYNGQAIEQVPVVSDEGIVYDGNGRTMAGQKAAKEGTDGEYISELLDNAESFGFTREQIEKSGIEHPRLVLVSDERMPYTTETFAKFNRNEKKTQSNTEQAVAKSKTLSPEDVGSIVAEIEGNGSLEAFFNNPRAISSLWKTLQEKGIIGQNEVAGLQDMPGVPNAQGKEFVKNLVLGAMFKPETIRMMGIDSTIKNKVIGGIRAIMDNSKLGDYALGEEMDGAIRLLYEARTGNMSVDDLLRSSDFVQGNARDRYSHISQAIAQALEGKASLFRELMSEYNDIARNYNTAEGSLGFYENLDKEGLIRQFVLKSKTINDNNIKLYGEEGRDSEKKGSDVPASDGQHQEEAGGGVSEKKRAEEQQRVDTAVKKLATEITRKTGVTVHTDDKESQKALEDAEATDSNIKYHKEANKEVLDELNSGKTIKVYRAMQVIDGKLYPPMAASVGGKLVEANELGTWIRADENPDLAIPDIDPKTGELKWKFKLDKGGKDATGKKATPVNAAYNPYWHMSRSPLNDQFKSAWIRPNVVVVECEVPESELTSGYKAERAKDAVGEVDWKSGSVSGEVFKQTGRARKVILSRWCKPVRVLSDEEVAQRAKEFVGDAKVEIPENVLTPKQRIAFEEAGFKIGAPEKGVKKSEQIAEALKAGLQIDNTVREHRADAGGAVLDWGNVPTKARISNDELTSVIMRNNRAYVDELDKLKDGETIEHYVDANGFFYTFRVDKNHHIYMDEAIPKTSSANKERIKELKDYYDGERARHPEEVHPNRSETQSELGRFENSNRSAVGGRDISDSAMGREKQSDPTNNVERDSSRSEQTGSGAEVRQFRTKDGEAYGFVVGGEIHLDTKKMKPETPLHEYTHLWTSALQRVNAKEWENVKSLLDSVEGLKEEVQKLYPELKGDDLYDEMLATYSGREGAKKLEEEAKRIAADEGKTLTESVKAKSFLGKVREALKRYWKATADMLHVKFTSAEEVADKVLADWARGVNPNEIKADEKNPLETLKKSADEYNKGKLRYQKADDADYIEDIPKGYRDFSDEHGVNPVNLFGYGESMKYNDSAAASRYLHDLKAMYLREHIAEKKALMEREGVSGLIANRRLFAPIEKAIKEKYGDVDVLIEERKKRVEAERGVMETARKRAEEEERKRQQHLEELSLIPDEDLDKRYLEAMEKGDETTAREMLDEAARRKGYGDAESDYQGVGAWNAPSNPGYESDEARRNAVGDDSPDLNVEDMAAGYSNQPEDVFLHPKKYSQGLPTSEESGRAIQNAIDAIRSGKKDVKIKVYRAVPTSVKEGKLRNGDWVTPSRRYAEMHGEHRLDGKYRIMEDEVPAKELWWDSNDVNEWGYDNGKSYRYKNVKNNRKLNDLVTRDDKGNIIPPSKRFNSRKADERYQKVDNEQAKADKREQALRDEVVGTMRKAGLDVSMDTDEGQRVLDEANGKVKMSAKKRRALETVSVSQDEKHQPTVVSSADGAKVLKELDTTKEKYENQSNRTNTFLGDVAKALGANRQGSASEYATFETKNGRIVTIRLANHNAKVSNFDHRDESDGISIVVSPKKSVGMENDGEAHVVEYYYDAIKLRRAEGKPLAEIVRSIKQALYSGEFNDTTGLAERQEVNGGLDHVRFFRTKDGDAYGYTIGGKIYIDPRIANSETPVHEYAHLWATALRNGNAKEWANVVGLMKDTKVWDEVKKRYPELEGDNDIADEVLATYSGRRGAERLRKEMDAAGGNAKGALERVKQAIRKFWKATADMLHIHYTSAEDVADRVMKDLLDGVDPRKFGGVSEKVRKQFIGERGAEKADRTEEVNTRLENLRVARKMEAENKDAKTIKMATGWERGADGKWRYEIADGKYHPKGDAEYKKLRSKQPWSKELDALEDRLFDGEELSESESKRFKELAEQESKFKAEFLLHEKRHLADWIENKELFDAYPGLKNVEMVFTDQLPKNEGGYYSEKENRLVVNTAFGMDFIESVIAHEVQHAIQRKEGFATGGSTEGVEREFQKAKAEWAARAYAHELEETAKELGEYYNQVAVEKALIKEYEDMDMQDWLPDMEARIKGFNYFARGYADRSMDDAIKRFRLDESVRGDFNPYTEYRKLAGEVEARNVQNRMGMTPEERRASLAAETEDVAREDQIFLRGGEQENMAHTSDPMDALTRAADEYGNGQRLRLQKKDKGGNDESLEKLFLSLQSKDKQNNKKEYYDTVTELARRISEGKADVVGMGGTNERKRLEGAPANASYLLCSDVGRVSAKPIRVQKKDAEISERGNENISSSKEVIPDGGTERSGDLISNGVRNKNQKSESERYRSVEEWAIANGCKYDESDIAKNSLDGKPWNTDGCESVVYRSKDGKSVIKVTRLNGLTYHNNSILYVLDRNANFNSLFKDTKIDVLGYGKDNEGYFSVITRQPLIEGKTVYEYFEHDDQKAYEYIDKYFENLGYKISIIEREGMEFDVYTDGKINLFDVNYNNVIIDKDGKPHVIDAEVLPVDYKNDGKIEIKGTGSIHFREEENLSETNRKFNERLDSLMKDSTQKGRELQLGRPGKFLKDAGLGDAEIVLDYDRLVRKASEKYRNNHPFSIDDIKDLPIAINNAIAVFDSTNGENRGKVILTELEKDGKNFIVAVRASERHQKGGAVLEVNEIRTLFPKEARGIVNWLNTNKACNINKEKALTWLGALRTHRGTELTEQELSDAAKVVNSFDISKQKGINYRIGDSSSVVDSTKTPSFVAAHVSKIARKLGSKVNMVGSPEEVTNPAVKERLERGEEVTGWYDEKTDEVHLYMPNIHDRYTAEKTIWHETVGHKGMRGLLGDKFNDFLYQVWKDLDKPENAELKRLVDEERRYNPLNIYDAIEEGIARLAENGKGEVGFWNAIKNKVTSMLRSIGYHMAPNTKDVKYLLWLSKNLQKNPNNPYWKMRAEAVRYKLEHEKTDALRDNGGYFVNNDGNAHDGLLDLNHRDFEEATDGTVHFRTTPMTASKIQEYNRRLGTKTYAFKESTVDHLQSLQEAMEVISGEKDVWRNIPSAFNPLQAANRIDAVCEQLCDKYDRNFTKPLDAAFKAAVNRMSGQDGLEQKRNTELYMIQKHGLERNRVFYVRDEVRKLRKDEQTRQNADTLQRQWDAEKKDLDDKLQNGTVDLRNYYDQMDEWIRKNVDKTYMADEHDYSGFHEMQDKKDNENYDDQQAIDDVMSAESQLGYTAKELWNATKAATDATIDQEYNNGFIDRETRDHLKGMFSYYVPLRRYDDTTAEEVYGYISEGSEYHKNAGPVIAKAKGRHSLSDVNVMAQISAMAKASIMNGGKNIVKQHLARFVSAYESGNSDERLFVEVKPWMEKHVVDGNEVWEEVTPQIPVDATQKQISDILQNFENDMQAKEAKGDAKEITRETSAGYKFERAKDKSQHLVEVYVAGKKRTFFCQGNPRAAQAVNGLLKDSGTKSWVTRQSANLNRFCAQMNTSFNPDFMLSNMMRDLTFASANVTKEGRKYTQAFIGEYKRNLLSFFNGRGDGNFWTMFSKYRNDRLNTNDKRERYFKEFMENGGETGFVHMEALDKLMREYDNLIKTGEKTDKGWLMRKLSDGGGIIEAANEVIENLARYSTYAVSREQGRSIGRSIYDAKEVSTNFNRHGSGDAIGTLRTENDGKFDVAYRKTLGFFNSFMKNHTMFYNAGIQGANLFVKNMKQAPATNIISFLAMPMGLGVAISIINQWLIGKEDKDERNGVEDPYAELPEWKRRNNLCFYVGKERFVTIPIAIELRAFYGLADIAMGMFNPNLRSDTPVGYDILGQMAQLVPSSDFLGHHAPADGLKEMGEDALLSITPTTLKPVAELVLNRDWTGRPIYRDKDYLDNAPRWKRAYDSTNGVYMTINQWANKATNGIDSSNEDMKGSDTADFLTAPYGWQHMVDGYLGGAFATMGRATKAGYALGKTIKDAATGKEDLGKEWGEFDKNQIPFWRVFNYKATEGNEMQRTKSKWYNYADELKQTEYNVSQLKTNSPDVAKNLENAAKKYNFYDTQEGKMLRIYEAADSYISKKRRLLKKVTDPETVKSIQGDINGKMQEAVKDLDSMN